MLSFDVSNHDDNHVLMNGQKLCIIQTVYLILVNSAPHYYTDTIGSDLINAQLIHLQYIISCNHYNYTNNERVWTMIPRRLTHKHKAMT